MIFLSIGTFVLLAFAIGGILFADTAGSKLVKPDEKLKSLNSAVSTKESAKTVSSSSVDNGKKAGSASTKQPEMKVLTSNTRIIVIAVFVSVLVLLAIVFFHRAPQPVPDPEPVPVTVPEPVPEPKPEAEEPKILGLWPRLGVIVVSATFGFIACALIYLTKFKETWMLDDDDVPASFVLLFIAVFLTSVSVLLALAEAIFIK
mgnify:CR=1 FL=1